MLAKCKPATCSCAVSTVLALLLTGPLTEAPPTSCNHGGMFALLIEFSTFANLGSGTKLSTGELISFSLLGFLFLSPNMIMLGSPSSTSKASAVLVGCSSVTISLGSTVSAVLLPLPIFTVRRMDCNTSVSSPGTRELARASAFSELVVDGVEVVDKAVTVGTTVLTPVGAVTDEWVVAGRVVTMVTGIVCIGRVIRGAGTEDG